METDWDAVAREVVRALRGRRSQVAFARRLGYRSNAVYTWESGRRWPPASAFLAAAERVGIDLSAGLRRFCRGDVPWLDEVAPASPAGVAALLSSLRGSTPIGQVAARAGRSRFAVSRWLSGTSEPRLPDLLRMVEATSLRGLAFVALFADPEDLPSTREAWARDRAVRALAVASPWAQAVLLALELAPYRALPAHDDGWLAALLGIGADEVAQALGLLVAAGQVVREGPRFAPVEVHALDVSTPHAPDARELKRFWAEVTAERLAAGAPGAFTYNLVAVSERDLARVEEIVRGAFRAIRALVADSAPAERLALVELQLLPFVTPAPPPTDRPGR